MSRLVVWVGGLAGILVWPTLSRAPGWRAFDPDGLTRPFGAVGDALAGPVARWDAAWYLEIARSGYGGEPARAAFFPLYPLLIRLVGAPLTLVAGPSRAYLLAGVAVSLAALLVGLVVVHRLAALELGDRAARLTVALVALFPAAFAFSAVYSESLFLALSAGSLYAGRLGRWRWAGLLGALAAATRSTGLLLVVPLALLHLYPPEADRAATVGLGRLRRPPCRPRRGAAWLAVVPLGLVGYVAYLGASTGDPLGPFTVGDLWYRSFTGPLGGAWQAAVAAVAGARQLASGAREPVLFARAAGDPFLVAVHNVGDLAFLLLAAGALVGVLRRLPLAYGAWALCGMLVPLSYPVGPEPLASLPRYLAVLFPLHMWAASWVTGRRRAAAALLVASALGLALLSAAFAAWQWVA